MSDLELAITKKFQILNPKSQTNHKFQVPNYKQTQYPTVREPTLSEVLNSGFRFEIWNLEFGISGLRPVILNFR